MSKEKLHLMVDIETMSTKETAHVFQVRLEPFDPYLLSKGGSLNSYYDKYKNSADGISLTSPIFSDDRHIDKNTVKFWTEENLNTLVSITKNTNTLNAEEMWLMLAEYLNNLYGQGVDVFVWGNGPSFDNVILRNGLMHNGHCPSLIPYYNDRCVRTITALASESKGISVKEFRNEVEEMIQEALGKEIVQKHNAEYDVFKQIVDVMESVKVLKNNVKESD